MALRVTRVMPGIRYDDDDVRGGAARRHSIDIISLRRRTWQMSWMRLDEMVRCSRFAFATTLILTKYVVPASSPESRL